MNSWWIDQNAFMYGIVNVSVANMRALPVYQSELVNQVIMGTILPIYETQNDFYYVQSKDGYWGWVNKHSVVTGDEQEAKNWEVATKVMVVSNFGVVRSSLKEDGEPLTDLVTGALLRKLNSFNQFIKVQLPDGHEGYLESANVIDETAQKRIKPDTEMMINTAKKFLGIPYLWGGNSSKGFDCSGFVQTVFRLMNIELPRDANQMAEVGSEVPLHHQFKELQIGDLLFFGKTLKRITHVALYLGNEKYIHAEGKVRINSLNPHSNLYNEYRHNTLLKAQRVVSLNG